MYTIKKSYAFLTIIRIFLIIFCFFSHGLHKIFDLDLIIFFIVIIYVLITLKVDLAFVIKYFSLIIPVGLGILGVFIIEKNRIWLIELQKYSYHAGSFPLFVGYYLLFLLSLEVFDRSYRNNMKTEPIFIIKSNYRNIINIFLDIFGVMFFIITLFMTIRLVSHPYFLVHMDRFQYQKQYITGVWQKFASYYYYFIPLLMINWHRKKVRKCTILTILLYIVYLFIQGEKYGGYLTLFLYCSMYFVPILGDRNRKKIHKFFHLVVVFVCIAACIVFLQYKVLFTSASPFSHFYQRFAQQGQLWWGIFDLQEGRAPHFDELPDELDAYNDSAENERPYYSIYKIMYLTAPETVVTSKIATGSTYTESTAASLYYYFGFPALPIFAVLMGWFFSFLACKYFAYIKAQCVIEVIVISRLISMGRSFFGMSRFTWLFDKETFVTVVFWGLMVAIRKMRGKFKPYTSFKELLNAACINNSSSL